MSKILFGFFAMVGFVVMAVLALALGLLAYDEIKRKLLGDDPVTPPPAGDEG